MGCMIKELRLNSWLRQHFYLLPKHVNKLVGPNQPPVTPAPQDLSTGKMTLGWSWLRTLN